MRTRRAVAGAALCAGFGIAAVAVASAAPAGAAVSSQWPLRFLKAEQCWQVTQGAGVIVAIEDDGVDPIPDVAPNLLSGADFTVDPGRSAGNGQVDHNDFGHGTGMASLIAGTGVDGILGLAPQAKILPVRTGVDNEMIPARIAAGIRYAADHHAGVLNISLGTLDSSGVEQAAVNYAVAHDVVIVAAGGNGGGTAPVYPAAYTGVIGASAVDDAGALWSGSMYGAHIAFASPGVDTIRDDNEGNHHREDSGTSQATAYVTASAALVRAAHPDWTAGQTIRALIATALRPGTAVPPSVPQRDLHYGYGIVDPLAAIHAPEPAQITNPFAPSIIPVVRPATPTPTPTPVHTVPRPSAPAAAVAAAHDSKSSDHGVLYGALGAAAAVAVLGGGLIARRRRRTG